MNASKRKFNALLSNFGSKSATSSPSKSLINDGSHIDISESELKRRRINRPATAFSQTISLVESISSTPAIKPSMTHKESLSNASSSSILDDQPKYAPWDRTAFLRRLESFKSVTDWTPKPAKVNEVEWAKRGWICRGQERVRCELCNVEILVKLNVKELDGAEAKILNVSDIEEALAEKHAQMVITSHAETCLWKQRGCDDTIFKLPLNHAPTTLHALRKRYDALCSISDRLPYMHNLKPPEDLDIDTVTTYVPNGFFVSSIDDVESSVSLPQTEINRVAFIMALFGWTARPETSIRDGAAICEVCFRTLGLWLFKSKEVNDAGEVIRPATMNYLDPVDQHREYCPWKSSRSQSGSDISNSSGSIPELAAWQIIIRVLKNDRRLRDAGKALELNENRSGRADTTKRSDIALDKNDDDDDAESIREEKDKERWARLRRVKSLFDTKSVRKLQKNSATITTNNKSPKKIG